MQVGNLFLTGSASAEQPLLLRIASEDLSSSELLFSPLPGQEHSKEADAWQVSLQVSSLQTSFSIVTIPVSVEVV